jgi:hypothetical protein
LAGGVCEAQCDEGCEGEGGGDGDPEQPVAWRTGSESGRQRFLLVRWSDAPRSVLGNLNAN